MTTYRAATEDKDTRLDVFLTRLLKDVSRSKIQKAIKSGDVLLNGKKVTPHTFLAAGDEITAVDGLGIAKGPATLTPRPDISLSIIYEDDEVAVINKPTGLLVHPTVRAEQDTLVNALIARFPGIEGVGESPLRPGIVHRLDKDASGILAVAKTDKAYRSLKRQFKAHTIDKEYLVLVYGKPPKDEGTITLSIGRSRDGGRMAARAAELEGDRQAVTHYSIVEQFTPATLLAVRTETGRTHQIRAHFKALGCPVAGDPLYKMRNAPPVPTKRLFLHAAKLAFTRPGTKKRLEFTAPLPSDLEEVLEKLRKP
jgi:23S rRNA pseudouridine1911/1915/1917 synthase